jgi:tRNA-dihydrouridine synthase C
MLLLAPMEGVLDHRLREVLAGAGGIDRCVSEFIRVTDRLLPPRVFTRIVPELEHGSRTAGGVPVRVQLLGSDPGCLAENAAQLAALGAEGVDLNFGCPAPVVNRHRGGAVLLDEPELVHRIVAAVRAAVPARLPVSAKMRLGFRDHHRMLDNARAIATAGASELVVHARTRADGYRPPARWPHIAAIAAAVPALPVVANGEVWTLADAMQCRAESGCTALMLGRGALADPGLARAVAAAGAAATAPGHEAAVQAADAAGPQLAWGEVLGLLARYWALLGSAAPLAPRHRAGRVKQWLNLLRRRHPQAQAAFDAVRTIDQPAAFEAALFGPASGPAPVRR